MRISIALCTYIGARFIEEQLQSLAAQTRLPDELVVCDDGSSDETMAIVSRFAARAPFQVLFSRNESQLGITRNFERAMSRCTGDVIFLCDQDDFWLPEKIQTLMQPFESDADVGLVFSDAMVTDAGLKPFDYTMWDSVGLTPRRQRQMNQGHAMDVLVRRYVVTGATLAFRASLRAQILPLPATSYHDAWVAAVAAMVSKVVAVRTPLILYRQHGANMIGGLRKGMLSRFWHAFQLRPEWFDLEIERARTLLQKMRATAGHGARANCLADLEQRIIHLERRRAMFEVAPLARIALIARELLSMRYFRFSSGPVAAMLDLASKGRRRFT
jgi:glycosyltransferase involved in cell wall biosynthesis